ncbi:hypothetical protein [Paraglaciecola sp. MB-3u-78]|uniref:hypothetical protein n=1 Tax=Paraglaciecola sp. MB-3u-78 TaxID=2058332 RepID=UPI0012FEB66D|nr:hypothetical protein [Paraglaciecola sp. MB-3u-78]
MNLNHRGKCGHRVPRAEVKKRDAVLHFNHQGWSEADDFFQHCNCKWGFFLAVSLKSYLEKGVGQPHPQDPNI